MDEPIRPRANRPFVAWLCGVLPTTLCWLSFIADTVPARTPDFDRRAAALFYSLALLRIFPIRFVRCSGPLPRRGCGGVRRMCVHPAPHRVGTNGRLGYSPASWHIARTAR